MEDCKKFQIFRLKEVSKQLEITDTQLRAILTKLKLLRRPLPLFTDRDVETILKSPEYAKALERIEAKKRKIKYGRKVKKV